MADTDDKSTTTVAKPPTRRRGQPRGDEAKTDEDLAAPDGDVLVFNGRLGPYVATHTSAPPNMPSGAGKDDPVQRIEIKRVIIPPGLFLLTAEQWGMCKGNRGFKSRVAGHALVVISDDPAVSWQEEWMDARPKRCLEWIDDTADVNTLKALLTIEERDEVHDALTEQLETIKDEGKAKAAARRAQRAHNRVSSRRRTRSGGLVD